MGKKGNIIELSVAKQSTRLPWDSSRGREGWLQCCTGHGYSGVPRDGRIFPPEVVLQARCGKPGEETQVITFFFFFFPDNGGRAKISVLILYSSSLSYNHPYSQIYYRKHPYPLTFSRKEKFPVKHSASCYMRSHSPHAYFARNSFGTYLCRADSDLFVPACLCLGYKPWLKNIWKYTSPFPFKYGALKASEVVGKLTAKKMGS